MKHLSITLRVTLGFLCATAVLYTLTAAFIYERMEFALNRSIADVPAGNHAERDARIRHRDEALDELLGQLALAFSGTLLVGGLVGYRVARAAIDPVERMRRRAASAAADPSFRLPVPDTSDEISRLAETLNELLTRVEVGVRREQRLVSDASHELRTPLSQLLLQADLALSRDRTQGELREALVQIQHDARRLVRLANDLLLIARADEGQLPLRPEPVAVREAAEQARERFADTARGAGRAIVVDADPALHVMADADRLGQLLDALVDNALVHGGGTITISGAAHGPRVALHVTDEGGGFPDDFRDRAFDRFATAGTGRGGAANGLGLAIVAALAEAHGGTALAANRPEGGADVWAELPAASPAAGEPRPLSRSATPG